MHPLNWLYNIFVSFSHEFEVWNGPDTERHPTESGAEWLGEEIRGGGDPAFLQAEGRARGRRPRGRGGEDRGHKQGELVPDAHWQWNGQRRGDGLLRRTRRGGEGGDAGQRDGKLSGVTGAEHFSRTGWL